MKKSNRLYLSLLLPFILTGCEEPSHSQEPNSAVIVETSPEQSQTKTATASQTIDVSQETKKTITITSEGKYTFTGKNSNLQIVINAPEQDVEISLNNADITSTVGSVIFVEEAKNVEISLKKNSTNKITDTSHSEKNSTEGAIHSTSDLKIKGNDHAILTVISKQKDAITSKDDLKLTKLDLIVTAADDGITGKDSVSIKNSNITITSTGDSIKSNNTKEENRGFITIADSDITIDSGDDAIHGAQSVTINSGNLLIKKSVEGIESEIITINGGTVTLTSLDDGLNVAPAQDTEETNQQGRGQNVLAGGMLTINGGTITLNSEGDGFDSNGNASMTGGTLIINGPTKDNNGPLDINGEFMISGGTIIAVGSAGMAETPSQNSSQPTLQVNFDKTQEAKSNITVLDQDKNEILSFSPTKSYQSITYSSPSLSLGSKYSILVDQEFYTEVELDTQVKIIGEEFKKGPGGKGSRGN